MRGIITVINSTALPVILLIIYYPAHLFFSFLSFFEIMFKITEQGLQVILSEIIVRYQFHTKKTPSADRTCCCRPPATNLLRMLSSTAVSHASLVIQLILMGKRKTHSFQCAFNYDAFESVYGSNNFIGS